MLRYRWPGYETHLLGELQKQQNNAQFCDTLLQTEGISVPTHSCVLAALSPYLYRKLSVSPSPPSGQKRQLQLQAVKAQTLLKLVSLLYTGELEVNGSIEQNDVLYAACQFGITDLVEGQKEPQKKSCGSCREKEEISRESRKMQDVQVQAETAVRRVTDTPIEKRRCVSTGTQTVKAGEMTAGSCFTPSGQNNPLTQEPASSVAQSLDFSITLHPQTITLDNHFYSTCSPPIPRGAQTNEESTIDRSSYSVTDPTSTSAWSSDVMSFPVPLNDDSNSPTPQEDSSYQRSPELAHRAGMGSQDKKMNGMIAEKRKNTEQPSHADGAEIRGEQKGKNTEKSHAHDNVEKKHSATMRQTEEMMGTTQISVKVKLRRRTKGEVWEVVSMQDADETFSVLTSLKQDGSNHKRPQTDLTDSEPPPSSVQPSAIHKPEALILQPAATTSLESPPYPNTTFDSQLLCGDCFITNQNDDFESVPLSQPPVHGEESDEQIEKLLEDIMMGLNILPNSERDCKKSHHHPPSHDGGQSSTETAQNQPSCSSLSSVQSDAVVIQQQCSPEYHSSVISMGHGDGSSRQGTSLLKSQNCPYSGASSTRPLTCPALYCNGQKVHHSACQEPPSQGDQNILEFLPLTNGNEAQSLCSLSSPCMDDLRLPGCLSPLETFASAAKHQPEPRVISYHILNNSTNLANKIQPQPRLHRPPWLAETPGSGQFPFSAITHPEKKSLSLPQDKNHRCWSKPQQTEPMRTNPKSTGTRAESKTVKEVKGGQTNANAHDAGHQNAAAVKSNRRKMKESLKCRQGDTKGDAEASKREMRRPSRLPKDAASSLLSYKDLKIIDGTKSQINLSMCSVSLLSNNVLAKERQMAVSSLNINKFLVKPDEPSTITECWREKTRAGGDLNTDQTLIRTRRFVKKIQETPSNTHLDNLSLIKPTARKIKIENEQGVLARGRKRGRPPKINLEDSPSVTSEKKIHSVDSQQNIDKSLQKEEDSEKTSTRFKKRRKYRSEVETLNAESIGKAEADHTSDIIPAERKHRLPNPPRMVTLMEFQKLIARHQSKTRKSKESQETETNETARDVDSDDKVCDRRCEELIKPAEIDTDMTQPQSRDGSGESHVIFNVTVDKNLNQLFNKSVADCGESRKETNSSFSEETSLSGGEYQQVISSDVLEGEVTELTTEGEQPRENPDGARQACNSGVSDATQQTAINDEGSSHSDTHTLPVGSPSDTVGLKNSDCDQEEEEEEVDVLLCSPDQVPQSAECENGLVTMDLPAEEEDEDVIEMIDVTGDETD